MRYWAAGLLLTVLLFGGGWLSSGAAPDVSRSVPGADPGQTGENAGQPAADADTVLRVWDGEQVVEMTMAEYLPGVVRGEMPAAFHQQAVRDTDGQVILYNGQPILAAFHSSSAGVTANSGDVWVSTLPYLHSVESPEGGDTVPNYYSVKEIPAAEFQQTFLAAYPEASFAGGPETWITGRVENASGQVESICIGGITVEGTQVRSLFGLRSACFTAEAAADRVTFRVTGFGHGVGMSQYGANRLAQEGKSWQEILHWYYTGVTIAPYGG